MKSSVLLIFSCLLFASLPGQGLYFPPIGGDTWETTDPESLGWCTDSLANLIAFAEQTNSKSLLILKDGQIVVEEYFDHFTKDSAWAWFSAGKSLTATLVGIAQQEGYLNIDQPTSDFLGTGWTSLDSTQESQITVRHQLSMTTGLNPIDFLCSLDTCLTYLAAPGTFWAYHNGPYSLLRNVIEKATGLNYNLFTNATIKQKTGMDGLWIPSGYNNFFFSTARSMARFGLLILNKGYWENTPVLADQDYYDEMVNPSQNLNPSYGYLWWLNGQERHIPPGMLRTIPTDIAPDAPDDLILAAGAQGQFVSIVPSLGLILIRQGLQEDENLAALDYHNQLWANLMPALCNLVDTKNHYKEISLAVFPNPAKDRIQVNPPDQQFYQCNIYNSIGDRVISTQIAGLTTLNLHDLPSGMYTLQLRNTGAIGQQRFLKSE